MSFSDTFTKLKSFLEQYQASLVVVHNESENYYLNTPATETSKKSEFFAAVQIKKSYVSVHLMPIYYYPDLLNNVSEDLKNKMQGKSCFNFKTIDDKLFAELNVLIGSSFEKYKSMNKI